MLQEVWRFHIGNLTIPIYGFGLMLVIGFLLGSHLAKYLARRNGIDGEILVNATMFGLIAGIVGARLSHILENLREFARPDLSAWDSFVNMINLTSGGLTYYGGFILAVPTIVGYLFLKKVPMRLAADICAPALMVALAIGRIGCFFNGCCYGAECDLPWAVHFPYYSPAYIDEYSAPARVGDPRLIKPNPLLLEKSPTGQTRLRDPRTFQDNATLKQIAAAEHSRGLHPAQLYSTITALLIAGICYCYMTLRHAPGRAFALMMILEGGTRFLLEMLRQEPPVIGHFSLSMIIGLLVLVAGTVTWFLFGRPAAQPRAAGIPATA